MTEDIIQYNDFLEQLDRNCNDCKYFKQIKWLNNGCEEANIFYKENGNGILFPPINHKCREGYCEIKKQKVYAIPQMFLGMDCFIWRK